MRKQVEAYEKVVHHLEESSAIDGEIQHDLEIKRLDMVRFELEALLRLEQWDDLDDVLKVVVAYLRSQD